MTSQQQPFPRLNYEFVDEQRKLAIPWYKLLITLWQRSGGSFIPTSGSVILQNTLGGIQAVDATSGTILGYVNLTAAVGGPAQPQVLGASPFTFVAVGPGTVVVYGGEVEVSRNAGVTWYSVTLNGGSVPLLLGDRIRVTWFDPANPPVVTFFPSTI